MRISVGALLFVSLPLLGGCDPDTSPVPSSETDAGFAGAAGTGGGGSAGMGGLGGTGGTGGTGGGAGMGGEGATGGSAGAPEDAGPDVTDDVQETGPDVVPDGPSCCPTDFAFTAVGASSVEMRGSPDPLSWSTGTPMTLQGGTWVAGVCLDVTREYRYKFVIDGTTWVHDETKPTVDDGQGGFNNVIGPLLVCE